MNDSASQIIEDQPTDDASVTTVYLVEDCGNCPGRIYAVFADAQIAAVFADDVEDQEHTQTIVVPRVLWFHRPPIIGANA